MKTFKPQLFVFNTVFELSHFHLAVLIYSGSLLMDYKQHILLAIKRKYFFFLLFFFYSLLKLLTQKTWRAWGDYCPSFGLFSESDVLCVECGGAERALIIRVFSSGYCPLWRHFLLKHLLHSLSSFFPSCLFTFYAVSEGQINSFLSFYAGKIAPRRAPSTAQYLIDVRKVKTKWKTSVWQSD